MRDPELPDPDNLAVNGHELERVVPLGELARLIVK
jgi:hypothetical protein